LARRNHDQYRDLQWAVCPCQRFCAGDSALLVQSAMAFNVLKLVGVGYLIWMGLDNLWQVLKTGRPNKPSMLDAGWVRPFHWQRSLRERGVVKVVAGFSLITFFFAGGQTIGPAVAGLIAQSSGSFSSALFLSAAITFVAAIFSLTLPRSSH